MSKIGTVEFYTAFHGKMPNPVNRKLLGKQIQEDFGILPEVTIPYDNYYDGNSPDFIDYEPISYNRELGHALFRGPIRRGPLHLTEYSLEDRAKKVFSRRDLVFSSKKPDATVSKAKITIVDGSYRKIQEIYFRPNGQLNINVRFTHGGDYDYDGQGLVEASFRDNRWTNLDLFYRREFEDIKPPEKKQEEVKIVFHEDDTFAEFAEKLSSLYPDPGEILPPDPPTQIRFMPVPPVSIELSDFNGPPTPEKIKLIGAEFRLKCIQPFTIKTATLEGRLRLQRMRKNRPTWDILVPFDIDPESIIALALSQGLEWRNINKVLPVEFNMREPKAELPSSGRKLLHY